MSLNFSDLTTLAEAYMYILTMTKSYRFLEKKIDYGRREINIGFY